ncbi:MAG: hypothetical protein KGL04_04760 [Elusimicrobia bacterium]|nr:hypothetical protein [Elusimicrobiota bacterium]
MERLKPQDTAEISRNPRALKAALNKIVRIAAAKRRGSLPMINDAELTSVFSISTALGFTLWQHLAAVERLGQSPEWQAKNAKLWPALRDGKELVGLATTHLARPENPQVHAKRTRDGSFLISGRFPWVSGFGMFNYLRVGFRIEDETVFALVDFPAGNAKSGKNRIRIERIPLGCLEGTATVCIEFKNWNVLESQVISRRKGPHAPGGVASFYRYPDIGMAKAALGECERILGSGKNGLKGSREKQGLVRRLRERLGHIEIATAKRMTDALEFAKDECIRDSVRMLSLISGGKSLFRDSLAFRLNQELLLLDAVFQPAACRRRKPEKAASGRS